MTQVQLINAGNNTEAKRDSTSTNQPKQQLLASPLFSIQEESLLADEHTELVQKGGQLKETSPPPTDSSTPTLIRQRGKLIRSNNRKKVHEQKKATLSLLRATPENEQHHSDSEDSLDESVATLKDNNTVLLSMADMNSTDTLESGTLTEDTLVKKDMTVMREDQTGQVGSKVASADPLDNSLSRLEKTPHTVHLTETPGSRTEDSMVNGVTCTECTSIAHTQPMREDQTGQVGSKVASADSLEIPLSLLELIPPHNPTAAHHDVGLVHQNNTARRSPTKRLGKLGFVPIEQSKIFAQSLLTATMSQGSAETFLKKATPSRARVRTPIIPAAEIRLLRSTSQPIYASASKQQ